MNLTEPKFKIGDRVSFRYGDSDKVTFSIEGVRDAGNTYRYWGSDDRGQAAGAYEECLRLEAVKPCPFCGGKIVSLGNDLRGGHKEGDPDPRAYFYSCDSCAAVGGWAKTETGALRNWNTRHHI
jgi:Lar family restriction alleviation protein